MMGVLTVARKIAKKALPRNIFEWLEFRAFSVVIQGYKERARHKEHYGKLNKDKTFYVFRIDKPDVGILSAYLSFLDEIQEADECGYVPVFDLKNNYLPLMQDKEKAHIENAWNYYFDPSNCCANIDEVFQSKNVILGWKNCCKPESINWMTKILNENEIRKFNRLAIKYMDFSPEIKERGDIFLNRIPAAKVLGMALRVSFLRGQLLEITLFEGHPIQKSLEETIKLAQRMMCQWQCDYIFISVEDREWLESFKKIFGDKCLYLDRERWHYFNEGMPVASYDEIGQEYRDVSMKKKTLDYLTEIYILSKCNCLYGSLSSGMTVAQILNNCHYEHTNICYNGSISYSKEGA